MRGLRCFLWPGDLGKNNSVKRSIALGWTEAFAILSDVRILWSGLETYSDLQLLTYFNIVPSSKSRGFKTEAGISEASLESKFRRAPSHLYADAE